MRGFAIIASVGILLICALPARGTPEPHRPSVVSLRRGVVWQRSVTYRWQDYAGRKRTATNHAERHTRSVAYLRWLVGLWNRRRRHAKHFAATLNRGTVQQVICRVFRPTEVCSTALNIAYRESRYQVTAWNSSDHGGLFQLGGPERAAYATIGYRTAYEQTVAAHNLYLARGWEPWGL